MDEQSTTGAPAGLFRRLAAMLYDALLVIALLFIATFAMLPLTGGEAILTSSQGYLGHLYHAILLLLVFGYFGLCWTHGGQTLGMKAWRLRLLAPDGRPPNWAGAVLRFMFGAALLLLALCGIRYLLTPGWELRDLAAGLLLLPALGNYAWVPCDDSGRSLQDFSTQMRMVRLP